MNHNLYSNKEFTDLKTRLNAEILRRSTFRWWDPLTTPTVGIDKSSPMSLPDVGERYPVDEKTYTINTPSEGSIERTKNIYYEAHGDSPSGENATYISGIPGTSAAHFTADEMRNFLVGLSKISDINLFYGRDEIPGMAYRDPQGIEDLLTRAEQDKLHDQLDENSHGKMDPNGGHRFYRHPEYPVRDYDMQYTIEDGKAYLPSGEYDGEEIYDHDELGPSNFFDDYGATPGDGNFHPYNRAFTPQTRRDLLEQQDDRSVKKTIRVQGGIPSSTYGPNPRNPQMGNEYKPYPVYKGAPSTCNVACTGMCSVTCDDQCSESCTATCWGRCGNACTATCGNVCTGCTTMCYSSCKTKCENSVGYACVKSGAKTVELRHYSGTDGGPDRYEIATTTHTCEGCSYSCQFYPNKKTTCWDAGCMGKCFTSCMNGCLSSCVGGCLDNASENRGDYKTGKGRGCSSGCTINCIGICQGVCVGECTTVCWHACRELCTDNCTWTCETNCGADCANACNAACKGCDTQCEGNCLGQGSSNACTGCSTQGGCTSMCQHDCNANCVGIGCKAICGIDNAGACDANCRINCMDSSCAAMCSDACASQCTTCVNTCGWQCGACSSACSATCSVGCEVECTRNCAQDCMDNCVMSCTDACGGCSNLCYSCVGMCIGICSVKCDAGCSNCTNMCTWWCDSSCNQECFSTCDSYCISTCSGSCATFTQSDTTLTEGPERDPTSIDYFPQHPRNREEEKQSFNLIKEDNDG